MDKKEFDRGVVDKEIKEAYGRGGIAEVVGICGGMFSSCWKNLSEAGEFESTNAGIISQELTDYLEWRIKYAEANGRVEAIRGWRESLTEHERLLSWAWTLICNAGWNPETGATNEEKTEGWHEGALAFREEYYKILHAENGQQSD